MLVIVVTVRISAVSSMIVLISALFMVKLLDPTIVKIVVWLPLIMISVMWITSIPPIIPVVIFVLIRSCHCIDSTRLADQMSKTLMELGPASAQVKVIQFGDIVGLY